MRFEFTGKGVQITPAMKEYAEKKITHLEKYIDIPDDAEVRVVAKVYQTLQKAEIRIPVKGAYLNAEAEHSDFYAAINLAVKKLEDQCRRAKTKREKIIYAEKPEFFEKLETISANGAINGLVVPNNVTESIITMHVDYYDNEGNVIDQTFPVDIHPDDWRDSFYDTWETFRFVNNIPADSVVDVWSNWKSEF